MVRLILLWMYEASGGGGVGPGELVGGGEVVSEAGIASRVLSFLLLF